MMNLSDLIRRFRRDEEASLSVELVLILPMIIWGFLSIYTIFDVFRYRNLALKANYAVSDLLSRETGSIDQTYLNGARDVFKYLTKGDGNTWLRVTQVYCNADCADEENRVLIVDWSHATDGQTTYTTTSMRQYLEPDIPLLAFGARAIVVETSVNYSPPFIPPTLVIAGQVEENGWGIMRENTFWDLVVTESRFGAQLCWTGEDGCS